MYSIMLATKMKVAIDWAYSEIGQKMANGQLLNILCSAYILHIKQEVGGYMGL